MCGIAGIHVFNPEAAPKYIKMEEAIDQLFFAIEHRGGDATGFIAIGNEGDMEWQKASCDAYKFYKERRPIPWKTRSVLLHTRMATQGHQAFPENNHPVRRGSVYVVHNGHVWNDLEIFKKTKRARYGSVDTEAIAALIAKYGIMYTHKAMEEISGAAAIGVVDETRPGLMVLARGSSSPLMFYRNENVAVFASTKEAVRKAWTTLYGTPPNEKKIEDVNEGIALYLDKDVERKSFTPDNYWTYTYIKHNDKYKSDRYCSESGCWNKAANDGFCNSCFIEMYPWKEKQSGPGITIATSMGDLCNHGDLKDECEICNPDDVNGSFLPVKREDTHLNWLDAKKCDLCDQFFPEDELTQVEDWDDKWLFCESCTNEMAEIITDCDITRPVERIHDIPLSHDVVLMEDGRLIER